MNGKRKDIHVPGYDGEERRHGAGNRATDKVADHLKLFAIALGIAMSIFAAGGGWVAAKGAIAGKVDEKTFAQKNMEQDGRLRDVTNRVERTETLILTDVIPQLREMKMRLRDIYCDGKPAGCQ